ncbi:hypothetical protein WG68_15210 [Arsukibacterium ikkense]|uniref:Uncharacterized protein n=1 Tax=Arsukibacterium ikkense TaxID=336831 RepID=A0A0M2V0L3_9GAMM|nr:hypothetical protein WG68_15210 [Arsukibacterium ikkense]
MDENFSVKNVLLFLSFFLAAYLLFEYFYFGGVRGSEIEGRIKLVKQHNFVKSNYVLIADVELDDGSVIKASLKNCSRSIRGSTIKVVEFNPWPLLYKNYKIICDEKT